uniref:Uncharacterized protein n=1 Tax=Tanacetum cinerariifolium TaxID=118510 RepID=A0A699IAD6_TANCI|nr:hypothetical protein [Tanacetum cinerariifolium]
MAAPVISISSDSSDESVGSFILRVILFGFIPAEIPVVLEIPIEVPVARKVGRLMSLHLPRYMSWKKTEAYTKK